MTLKELTARLWPFPRQGELLISGLKGDASSRCYYRVTAGEQSCILCIDPAFRALDTAAYPFLVVAGLLSGHGIRIPEILAVESTEGALLLEDCGDRMLQDEVLKKKGEMALRYRQVIDLLVRIQSIPRSQAKIPFSLSFDVEKLMFEFDFFIEHALLGRYADIFQGNAIAALRHEFEKIASSLVLPEHFVLNHRDFHSRNLMLFHNEPVVIDFQDARLGLPQYDAVSLLRDSYIQLDQHLLKEMKQYHFEQLQSNGLLSMKLDEYLHYFDLMAFQRNIKAIGTFCYQTGVVGNNTFEGSIAPTVAYLQDYIAALPELAAAGKLLEPLLATARP